MENPNLGYLCGRLLCFDINDNGSADATSEENWLQIEVVDHGGGFVEIAFNDRNERCYVAFRISDLLRAVKERAQQENGG